MPRYFFHFASKDEFIPDDDGIELAGLAAAHDHARRLVGMAGAMFARLRDGRSWTIEIADEDQLVHLVVLVPVPRHRERTAPQFPLLFAPRAGPKLPRGGAVCLH
jgi:hypothetical protein